MLLLLPPLLPLLLLAPPHYRRPCGHPREGHAGDEGSHPTKVTSFVDERETLGSPGFHAAILDLTQTTATIDIAVRAAAGAEQH